MLLPVYQFFRFLAHMRAIVAVARTPEARAALSPATMTVAWIVVNTLAGTTAVLPAPLWVSVLTTALGAALIGYAQSGLNAAWHSLPGGARRARVHPVQWLVLLLGLVIYVKAAITIASLSPESP